MIKKVVVTGRGLVTPLGNGLAENVRSLMEGKTGTVFMQEWADHGLDTRVAGVSDREVQCPMFNVKNIRFMAPNARMAAAAAYEAFVEAGLPPENLPDRRIAMINGCAGSSYETVYRNMSTYERTRKLRSCSPFSVPKIMPSCAVANMSLLFGTTGESYDISCACTSSALAIIAGARLISAGEYDLVLAGGSEELSWAQALGFCSMRALSTRYNDCPGCASRPFDKGRDGFVLADGAGMVVLESEEHAIRRGAVPRAVISGYYSNSNAIDMVMPNADSTAEVMSKAIENAGLRREEISYVNTHGTGTPVGDPIELAGIHRVFSDRRVAINSTKSMTGHMIGAAGAVEAIFTTLMIEHSFISKSANLEQPEEGLEWADLVRETRPGVEINHAISNSFGFGGSNATLVISKYKWAT
ncbi:MAG: 3-oxoacyl-(acyl-carrier-protein) synthase 1 [Lentisphaerae bacterium ADurb.Bin242]|nr:MAG: 3-oxoacyl-(acyl-carrier-protein) synthase 1 [Lentisphaerae bacterium ADurb.Bin242]